MWLGSISGRLEEATDDEKGSTATELRPASDFQAKTLLSQAERLFVLGFPINDPQTTCA